MRASASDFVDNIMNDCDEILSAGIDEMNKSVKDIAEETGLTVKGVEYHITKTLKVLRIRLKDYSPILCFFL